MSNIEDVPPVPKIEPFEEESFSESSPEPEEQSLTQEPAQVQKRKGGRKPVQDYPYLHSCHTQLTLCPDLCDLRGTQTKEPSSTGSI